MAAKTKKRRMIRTSKLTSKYQATVPNEVRKHLRLKKGDRVAYELLSDGTVVLRKPTPLDMQYLDSVNTSLSEWESEDDEQAYKNL